MISRSFYSLLSSLFYSYYYAYAYDFETGNKLLSLNQIGLSKFNLISIDFVLDTLIH